jgi:hypothetical protein
MSDEDLVFDGVCPVCGEEFDAPGPSSMDLDESYDAKLCMLPRDKWRSDGGPGFLVHLPGVGTDNE